MTPLDFDELKTNGIKVNYYFVCKRKLWLFDRGLGLEETSERVILGKLLHDFSYLREKRRNVLIDNLISIDIVGNEAIGEIKYSRKLKEASRWQLYYYLFYLERLGIKRVGFINYPRQKKREKLELTEEVRKRLIKVLRDIREVLSQEKPPPPEKKPICKSCSYYYLCFVE